MSSPLPTIAANLGRVADAEKRAMLDAVPSYGTVTSKGKRIVIDFYPDLKGGERYLQSFVGKAFEDQADAERVRKAICRLSKDLGLSEAVARYRSSRSKTHSFEKTIEAFFHAVDAKEWQSEQSGRFLGPRTVANYRRVLRRAEPFFEGMTFNQATEAKTLRLFKAWFRQPKPQGRGLKSDQETRNAFSALRSVVRWYKVQNPDFQTPDWPSMPTAATAKRENENERDENRLTLDQTIAGIDCIPEERQPIFWTMFYTQSRPTEARAVLGLDFTRPTLEIRRSASDDSSTAEPIPRSKTGERGTWSLPAALCDLIDRHCAHVRFDRELPLFRDPHPLVHGNMYSYDALSDTWRTASKAAGIPWVPPYRAFKHTIVTAYRDAGMSIEDIVTQCRFRSDQMVDVYDQRANERRSGTVAVLEEWVEKSRKERR